MAQTTDDAISLYDMPSQRFRYIEDENMNWTNLDARWYSQTSLKAVPMLIVPVPQGEWTVEISMEGYQPTSSTTDPNKDKQDGLIAYNDDLKEGWNVGIYNNVEITNNKADNTLKYGHPDMELNNCHFNQGQCLERDGDLTCHVKTTGDDASFFIVGPAVQKQSKYNYAVSYGAWTDRMMEIGMIAIALDEQGSSGSTRIQRPKRVGHSTAVSTWETINFPGENPPEISDTSQRQDVKTPLGDESPGLLEIDHRGLPSPVDEHIPDFVGDNPWSDISTQKSQEEEAVSQTDSLKPQLKPPGLPKSQSVSGSPKSPAPLKLGESNRIENTFKPTPELLAAWDPGHFNPGYTRADVAAATILAGGNVHDGRSMLAKRDAEIENKRRTWVPSLGGSSVSSLQGGSLRKLRPETEQLKDLTTAERAEYERVKNSLGKTQAANYLRSIRPP